MENVTKEFQLWNPFAHLDLQRDNSKSTSLPSEGVALLILNQATSCDTSLKSIWNKCVLKVVVDGGINILHENCCKDKCIDEHIPDIISGDFDSAKSIIIEFYKKKGVEVIHTPDQNATDFTKALILTINRLKERNQKVSAIITLTSLGERLDHVFANINTLFIAEKLTSVPVYLVSDFSISWLLNPGCHLIEIPQYLLNVCCGIIPVGEPCFNITTNGFKWNLKNETLQFGTLVSTSNTFSNKQVTIEIDKHVLFTMERLIS